MSGPQRPRGLPRRASAGARSPRSSPVALHFGAVFLDVPELAAGVALLLVGVVAVAGQVAGLAAVVAALLPLPLGLLAVLGDVAASAAVIAGFSSGERAEPDCNASQVAPGSAPHPGGNQLQHAPLARLCKAGEEGLNTYHPPEGHSPWQGDQTLHSDNRCLEETRRQTGNLFWTETKHAWLISPVLILMNTEVLQNSLFDKNTSIRGKTTSATASHSTTAASTSGALPGPVARPSALEALVAAHGCSQIFKTLETTL